jgi:hypothetical protein
MSFVKSILGDLREKKLWPVAAVLLVAVIAVPVVLSKGSSSSNLAPVAQLPSTGSGAAAASGLPAVSVSSVPSEGRINGKGRNPFAQFGGSTSSTGTTGSTAAATTAASGTPTASSGASSTSGSGTSSGGTGASGSGSSSSGTVSTPPSITNPTPPRAPAGLTATESYDVSLAITNSSGGVDTFAPLERLSVLPSTRSPLLVELGVLKGGNRVLFAVQPGAVVSGPGSCIPGPVDCELLSLAPGQTEALGAQSSSGTSQVALFAVNEIAAAKHASSAEADKARRATSAAGRSVLANSTSSVLSLFPYEPSIGALVDDRNLTVGG